MPCGPRSSQPAVLPQHSIVVPVNVMQAWPALASILTMTRRHTSGRMLGVRSPLSQGRQKALKGPSKVCEGSMVTIKMTEEDRISSPGELYGRQVNRGRGRRVAAVHGAGRPPVPLLN
jgi:hypothetical protein